MSTHGPQSTLVARMVSVVISEGEKLRVRIGLRHQRQDRRHRKLEPDDSGARRRAVHGDHHGAYPDQS